MTSWAWSEVSWLGLWWVLNDYCSDEGGYVFYIMLMKFRMNWLEGNCDGRR